LSRSEWAIRLLKLPESTATASEPGLILIQIDGLARAQFDRALAAGRLPFMRRLIGREGYRVHDFYSGLPSSTPAVQGELFYGVRCAVPSFSFAAPDGEGAWKMYDPGAAEAIERELAARGEALLEGGSSYSNIYGGGARETNYCAASLGWDDALRAANPIAMGAVMATQAPAVARTIALFGLEVGLAVVDCVRGVIAGRDLVKELKFVPTRAAISILLRELVTIGAKIDAARGLPVIHVNYLGYDEQAHRRGPGSAFAHRSLKGIDASIAKIWRSARRSARRDYDLWVYSDHGQEETDGYPELHGRTLGEATAEIFAEMGLDRARAGGESTPGVERRRARLLGGRRLQRMLPAEERARPDGPAVAAMGPIGHVYPPRALTDEERETLARRLVEKAGVPLVLAAEEGGGARAWTERKSRRGRRRAQGGGARAWTERGEFRLPEDAGAVLGERHPFLQEATRDLIELCAHRLAGALVVSGWRPEGRPISFPIESGAHGGPGREETRGFALLPSDASLPARRRDYLRPAQLREGALRALGRRKIPARAAAPVEERDGRLRVVTYNVHSCIGMDGKLSPRRIARVIARLDPDVVALQELDAGRARSNGEDQARTIAHHLQMLHHFHPAIEVEEERYGDAVLSRLPMRLVRAGGLPGPANRRWHEPRGAIWVVVEHAGREIQLLNTHLGMSAGEQRLQVEALLGGDWIGDAQRNGPIVFCGDFNAGPGSATCRGIGARLADAQTARASHRPLNTWFGRAPMARIDHVFVGEEWEVVHVERPTDALARLASDHLPLVVDLRVRE
jgi:endonuclease/exonuclease/phosphatase family metal-dependent hydrolase